MELCSFCKRLRPALVGILYLALIILVLPDVNSANIPESDLEKKITLDNLTLVDPTSISTTPYPPLNDPSKAIRNQTWRKEIYCKPPTKGTYKFANNAEDLLALRNCTVIEGSLQILWMWSNATADNYTRAMLPNLTEITGHLLLYRIQKLTDLGVLFPNLRVIRGQETFYNFALIVFELEDLQALNLNKLAYLGNGYTAQRNPNMCYNSRIEWNTIIPDFTESKLYHYGNRVESLCKTFEACGNCKRRSENCWNANVCANRCEMRCDTQGCADDGNGCCHEQCLGGCVYPNDATACYACQNIFHNGTCREKCPTEPEVLYGYNNNRRCITARECLDLHPLNKFHEQQCVYICPLGYLDNTDIGNSDRSLSEENFKRHQCVRCEGECDKVCQGGRDIDSVESASSLEGCTIIDKSLSFRFAVSGNLEDLKSYTERIHTIKGVLSIKRSHLIPAVGFLPALKEVRNNKNEKYAVLIMNNENLRELWTPNTKIMIGNGSVQFQQNNKLCYSTIMNWLDNVNFNGTKWNETGMVNITRAGINDFDVSQYNNGQFGSCFTNTLNLTLSLDEFSPSSWVNFNFTVYDIRDKRQIINYYVYHRPVEEGEEVSYYSSRDVCSNTDRWQVEEFPYDDTWLKKKFLTDVFASDAYTRHAVYVETLMAFNKGRSGGAQSPIKYIRTAPIDPSPPRITNVIPLDAENIGLKIQWEAPEEPNGILHKYKISFRKKPWPAITNKNFCEVIQEPDLPQTTEALRTTEAAVTENPVGGTTTERGKCAGETVEPTDDEKRRASEKKQAEFRLRFENKLQNMLFDKFIVPEDGAAGTKTTPAPSSNSSATAAAATSVARRKRQAYTVTPSTAFKYAVSDEPVTPVSNLKPVVPNAMDSNTTKNTVQSTTQKSGEGMEPPGVAEVNASMNEVSIYDLEPQTEYIIEIVACQAYDEDQDDFGIGPLCSQRAVRSAYTEPDPSLDVIEDLSFKYKTVQLADGENYNFTWLVPNKTNGPILTYQLEQQLIGASKNDSKDHRLFCIGPKEFEDNGGYWSLKVDNLLRGREYNFRLRAQTLGQGLGGKWTTAITIKPAIEQVGDSQWYIILAVILSIVVLVCIILVIIGWKRMKDRKIPKTLNVTTINPDYMDTDYIYDPDEWEIDRSKISIGKVLGNGSFGMVYEGVAKELPLNDKKNLAVAIKTNSANSPQEGINFLQEATRMKSMDCHHIVKLLAVVSQGIPKLVVMELMANGDLKNYLRRHRPDESDNDGRKPPTLGKILQMAAEIADGMCYIAEKKYVHRDLAARNCMVAGDMTVKIGDFGMSRDIYETDYYRKGGRGLLPVRWMSPESLRDGVYTCKSDVWSYGVVLWEMATLATQPYPGLGHDEVYNYVVSGRTMEMPDGCPEKLFSLMKECWRYYPKYRPTFQNILEQLQGDVHRSFFQCSWYYTHRDNDSNSGSQGSEIDDTDESQPLNPDSHHGSADNFYMDTHSLQDDETKLLNDEDKSDNLSPPEIPYKPEHLINTEPEPLTNGHAHSSSEESIPLTNQVDHSEPVHILPDWSGESKSSDGCNGSANGHLKFNNQLTSAC